MFHFPFVTSTKHNDRPAQHTKLCVEYRTREVDDQVAPKGIRGLASMNKTEIKNRGAKIFQNSSSQLKILSARKVTQSNFHTVGPHILGTTFSVITTIRRPSFMHP